MGERTGEEMWTCWKFLITGHALLCTHWFICVGGWFLFLIQQRLCVRVDTHTHTPSHTFWSMMSSSEGKQNQQNYQSLPLFSKLQWKLECERRMKGWSADRAAERGREGSFSPDYRAATDYAQWIMRVWPNGRKKNIQAEKQPSRSLACTP